MGSITFHDNWKERTTAERDMQQARCDVLDLVCPVLIKYDGKTPTRRIETAIKKVLSENMVVTVQPKYGWTELAIWGGKIAYDDAIRINLGYGNRTLEWDRCDRLEVSRYYRWRNEAEGRLENMDAVKPLLDELRALEARREALLEELRPYQGEAFTVNRR
jgi:hypothetical protein